LTNKTTSNIASDDRFAEAIDILARGVRRVLERRAKDLAHGPRPSAASDLMSGRNAWLMSSRA
jgi:hypothetical protein